MLEHKLTIYLDANREIRVDYNTVTGLWENRMVEKTSTSRDETSAVSVAKTRAKMERVASAKSRQYMELYGG